MPYKGGLYPGIFPIKDFRRSRVMEIAPDIWMIEGYISSNFLKNPPSCNCFVLRDGDLVLLVDTGTYGFYREPILQILRRYRKEGARRLVLMLTQGHFDHVGNNDLILEAGYDDVRFLLPEVELTTIDLYNHWNNEAVELLEYYNPFRMLPMEGPTIVPNLASRLSIDLARAIFRLNTKILFRGIKTLADRAEVLPPESRVRKQFGDVELRGWEVGRFFAVHDGTHSPGHISFYDPEQKVFLTGDATLEINPPFFNGSMDACIEYMGRFRRLAEQGYVELATDAHRSSLWTQRLQDEAEYEPIHPLQKADVVTGKDDCAAFYGFFEEYFKVLKAETLGILERLGQATIPEIVEEFRASRNPYVRFKNIIAFPKLPSRTDVMVANILKEANVPRRREGDRIIFAPPGKK